MTVAHSHCPYCSLNCGMNLDVRGDQVVGVKEWKAAPLTGGSLCGKGTTAFEQVNHPDRLTEPLVRVGSAFHAASWDEALDAAAEGFLKIRDAHGPDANAVLSGGSLTNEKLYLLGKFARLALKTRNVDGNGRFGMAAASLANSMAFGADRMMTPLDELRNAEVVVVIGAHISAAFPVVVPTLLSHVRRRGGKVIVVDPRAGSFVKKEDLHVALEPGTDAVFFNGLLRESVRQALVDREFVEQRTVGFADAVSAVMDHDAEFVERVADVPKHLLEAVAKLIGTTDRCMFLHGRGAEQHPDSTQNVLSIINVGLACGHVGRPGSGINLLTGHRNGQGAREWGQLSDQLPAGRSMNNDDHRNTVAERWGVDEAELPTSGSTYVDILNGVEEGATRGLLTIATNMAISAPDGRAVRRQLEALEHHVIIDPFFSASAAYANVVLPGSTFAEETGTVTTLEGRVIVTDKAVAPLTGWSDLDILAGLAERLESEVSFRYPAQEAIFDEMRTMSEGAPVDISGMTYERLRESGGIFWPCPTADHPGTPQLYQDRFSHADGKARFHAVAPRPIRSESSKEFPLLLMTGRLLAHFLTANQTGRIQRQQERSPGPYIELHPTTAAAYGIDTEDLVEVTSQQGTVRLPWRANRGMRYDTLFMPYHWAECNVLVSRELDPASAIPSFKYTPIRIEPTRQPFGVLAADGATEDNEAEQRELVIRLNVVPQPTAADTTH